MENNDVSIPMRFRKEVTTHVLSNLLAEKQPEKFNNSIPLLLGIHGASGEGKTYQIEKVLKELKYEMFHISGSELESEEAGKPGRLIKQKYKDAGQYASDKKIAVAILIDDVDAGFGLWGNMYQYTVNTQIVIATLMHLADSPKSLDDEAVMRIPIILTGNDFTKIYGSI
jgi:AAA+ superfamily predicted ATPase